MEFTVKSIELQKIKTNCIIVPVFEGRKLSPIAQQLDALSNGYLQTIIKKGDLDGKVGQTLMLYSVPNIQSDRILLVGCGKESALGDKEFRTIQKKTAQTILQTGTKDAVSFLSDMTIRKRDLRWKIQQTVISFLDSCYHLDDFRSKKTKILRPLNKITFVIESKRDSNSALRAIEEGRAIAEGVAMVKNLGNTPPNICTPSFLAKEAEDLSDKYTNISTAILDEKDISALKMGAFLSVGQGSKNPPRLITLEYRGRKEKSKPIILVGKGITFDTGGNSLKLPANMIGMKFDMCGAATVLAIIRAAAALELPMNLIGVVPTAENMPGNTASRPDDVVTTMSGLTVEILNTDAEGRLILCDALTYCERFDPESVIDIATLTGACAATFSSHTSGLLSNHAPLANELFEAGLISGDKCWQLPLWEDYQDALSSHVADIANIGTPPEAGTILAATFLARFTEKFHWAHLDVAGTAFRTQGKDRGATGRPVPLLMEYLLNQAEKRVS